MSDVLNNVNNPRAYYDNNFEGISDDTPLTNTLSKFKEVLENKYYNAVNNNEKLQMQVIAIMNSKSQEEAEEKIEEFYMMADNLENKEVNDIDYIDKFYRSYEPVIDLCHEGQPAKELYNYIVNELEPNDMDQEKYEQAVSIMERSLRNPANENEEIRREIDLYKMQFNVEEKAEINEKIDVPEIFNYISSQIDVTQLDHEKMAEYEELIIDLKNDLSLTNEEAKRKADNFIASVNNQQEEMIYDYGIKK